MEARSPIFILPPEIVTYVLRACSTTHDLLSLARSCKHIYYIFKANDLSLFDHNFRHTLPAFDDALRVQRASISAMRHLKNLDYDDRGYFQSLLPPAGTAHRAIAVCRFDRDLGEYINIPTEDDIIKLGEKPLASLWEAQQVLRFQRIVSVYHDSLRTHTSTDWFFFVEQDHVWTPDQKERFFRGAFRYWLYCALFYPGCYAEPFLVEKENFKKWSSLNGELYYEEVNELPPYPIYLRDIGAGGRKRHVESLFTGFTTWLVHDGEQRGLNECLSILPDSCGLYGQAPPATRGGMRELMLIHSMESLLIELLPELEPSEEPDGVTNGRARIPDFHFDGCAILRAELREDGSQRIRSFALTSQSDDSWTPNPWDTFYAFSEYQDGWGRNVACWPGLEGIMIGLAKHYNVKLSRWIEQPDDVVGYKGKGGVVLDILARQVRPIVELDDLGE